MKKDLEVLKNILNNTDKLQYIQTRMKELDDIIEEARKEQEELIREYASLTGQKQLLK